MDKKHKLQSKRLISAISILKISTAREKIHLNIPLVFKSAVFLYIIKWLYGTDYNEKKFQKVCK